MGSTIVLTWSKLLPFGDEYLKNVESSGGVFRISRKDSDGKFYVVYIGGASDMKKTLEDILSGTNTDLPIKPEIDKGEHFAFKYANIVDVDTRKAIEKQLYKQYVPKYNIPLGEPTSSLDIKANLN